MATFSLSGDTPGAPGVYINERAGISASAAVASFSTVYMLVEAPESAPVQVFPFNTPVPVQFLLTASPFSATTASTSSSKTPKWATFG